MKTEKTQHALVLYTPITFALIVVVGFLLYHDCSYGIARMCFELNMFHNVISIALFSYIFWIPLWLYLENRSD